MQIRNFKNICILGLGGVGGMGKEYGINTPVTSFLYAEIKIDLNNFIITN